MYNFFFFLFRFYKKNVFARLSTDNNVFVNLEIGRFEILKLIFLKRSV